MPQIFKNWLFFRRCYIIPHRCCAYGMVRSLLINFLLTDVQFYWWIQDAFPLYIHICTYFRYTAIINSVHLLDLSYIPNCSWFNMWCLIWLCLIGIGDHLFWLHQVISTLLNVSSKIPWYKFPFTDKTRFIIDGWYVIQKPVGWHYNLIIKLNYMYARTLSYCHL
jgi:hypothetical protein